MDKVTNKAEIARSLGIARSSLYYQSVLEAKDENAQQQIQAVLNRHPHYGHKRVALELGWNKKRALRIMNKFNLHPKRRKKKPDKPNDMGNTPSLVGNIANTFCPICPNALWVGDFTYLPWKDDFIYLATVLDVYTREIVGWHIGLNHTSSLVIEAFLDGVARTNSTPAIFHSDQGSEYISNQYEKLLETLTITPSHSKKSSHGRTAIKNRFTVISSLSWETPNDLMTLESCARLSTSRSTITTPAGYTPASKPNPRHSENATRQIQKQRPLWPLPNH